jgi:hypothetical protein
MRSPVKALIWEQWRQVRLPIAFGIGLTFAASWCLHYTITVLQGDANAWVEFSTVMAGIALVLLMAALLFAHSSPRDLRMGLPARMLTLPVSPRRIAAAQIGFRFAMVGLVALAIGLSLTVIDRAYVEVVAPMVGISVLCYSYASAVAVTVGRRSPVIAFVTIILTIGPVIATVGAIHKRFGPFLDVKFAVFYAFVAACAIVSFISFVRIRNAPRLELLLNPRSLSRAFGIAARGKERSAQFAYEWRRLGWMFPCFTAGLAVAIGLPVVMINWTDWTISEAILAGPAALFVYGPPIVAFVIGMIFFARAHRDSVTGVARFAWTRPTTVQQVVLHRMKAIALSMLLTYAVLGVLTAMVNYLSGELTNVNLDEAGFAVLCYLGILLLSWCLVWAPYVPVVYWIIFAVYSLGWGYTGAWGGDEDFWLLLLPESLFLLALFLLAYTCWRRRIIKPRVVVRFALLCAVPCAIALWFLTYLAREHPDQELADPRFFFTAFVLGLMPLFALFFQGVFLDHVRHGALFRSLPPRDV